MIEALTNFFEYIKMTITQVWSFFENIINGLKTMVRLLPIVLSYLTSFISSFPPVITVFATITITITIIYLIIGRNTGGKE